MVFIFLFLFILIFLKEFKHPHLLMHFTSPSFYDTNTFTCDICHAEKDDDVYHCDECKLYDNCTECYNLYQLEEDEEEEEDSEKEEEEEELEEELTGTDDEEIEEDEEVYTYSQNNSYLNHFSNVMSVKAEENEDDDLGFSLFD